MAMILDYKQLWDAGGYGKDNPLENTVSFIRKRSGEIGAPVEAADLVIQEIMTEVASGKTWPTDKCPCGCGIDKSGTAITHEMLNRLYLLGKDLKIQQTEFLQDRHNTAILGHIQRENEAFTSENMAPPPTWRNWSKSETVRAIKWITSRLSQ